MKIISQRQSSFELMRLLAQFMIVYYHILLFLSATEDSQIIKALQIPVHIGVPLFVIISGYFGIKPSPKGLLKLLSIMFIYTVPLMLIFDKMGGGKICCLLPIALIGLCAHIYTYICFLLLLINI